MKKEEVKNGVMGVITAGGDAPGMNAAIRSVVRSAHHFGYNIVGYRRGWWGLLEKDYRELDMRSVSNILSRGGTILHTGRCPLFREEKHRNEGAKNLEELSPDGLVVIGGDGSMKAAYKLSRMTDVPIVGIPASIDNDIPGTDETIGFDTAINTALEATDKIRDTATSHQRIFIVEVMGRRRGFLALNVGITAGAEIIIVPELEWKEEDIIKEIKFLDSKGKHSIIIVMAEGAGDARKLAKKIEEKNLMPVRVSTLGYIQRGGSPTVDSRLMASLFGFEAVNLIKDGKGGLMVSWVKDRLKTISLEYPFKGEKKLDTALFDIAKVLSR
ncbi:MAG: ATP-dependent 6-phosphofructokinase [Elusimicrobiota bacterium]